MDDFDQFWAAYPLKLGKGHARKKFEQAMKLTTLEEILHGIELYKRHKPDWKAYKHPSTWLNGECWSDEWPEAQPKSSSLRPDQILFWQSFIKAGKPVPDAMKAILRENGVMT